MKKAGYGSAYTGTGNVCGSETLGKTVPVPIPVPISGKVQLRSTIPINVPSLYSTGTYTGTGTQCFGSAFIMCRSGSRLSDECGSGSKSRPKISKFFSNMKTKFYVPGFIKLRHIQTNYTNVIV
jgi:hypothetical protein